MQNKKGATFVGPPDIYIDINFALFNNIDRGIQNLFHRYLKYIFNMQKVLYVNLID